jgi:hypothetical protein
MYITRITHITPENQKSSQKMTNVIPIKPIEQGKREYVPWVQPQPLQGGQYWDGHSMNIYPLAQSTFLDIDAYT